MTPERKKAIAARLARITPGRWVDDHVGTVRAVTDPDAPRGYSQFSDVPVTYDDSRFIAHAPEDIRELLSYVAKADAVLYRAKLTANCTSASPCKCMSNLRDALAALESKEGE